jgi:putative ABC transport system permease protein
MIGIITYISVIERTKEIGVLRSVGASKKDVKRVFTAESFIIGLASGLFGVFDVTYYHVIWLILFAILLASVEVQVKTRDSKKVETLTPLNK